MSIITRPGFRVAKCGHEYATEATQGRQRLYGDCDCRPKRPEKKILGPCVVDQCPRKEKVRQMCTLHYTRWLRTGDVGDPSRKNFCKFCELDMPLYEPSGRTSIRRYCDDECKRKFKILLRLDFSMQEIDRMSVEAKKSAVDSYINKRCRNCNKEFDPDISLGQSFCSKSCSKRYHKVNNPNPCSESDCDRPHLAQGLCSMHYKRQARAEGRWNETKLVECIVCGAKVERSSGGGRKYGNVCSTACRQALNPGRTFYESCKLPDDHWVRWIGKTSKWPRYGLKDCPECGSRFAMRTSVSTYCSMKCSGAAGWAKQREKLGFSSYADNLSKDRYCERCGKEYRSPYAGRAHCSDFCRDADADGRRKLRGTKLYHGWISRFDRLKIYERDNYICWLCDEPVDRDADPQKDDWAPSLDHVVPRSRGGSHDPENLRTAHRWCNSVRSDNDYHDLFGEVLV